MYRKIVSQVSHHALTGNLDNLDKELFDMFSGKNQGVVKEEAGIKFVMTKSAGEKLSEFTGKNIGKRVQIIFKDSVITDGILQASIGMEFIATNPQGRTFSILKNKLKLPVCPIGQGVSNTLRKN